MRSNSLNERDFASQVEDLLNVFGFRWCHFRPARTQYSWRTAISGHQGFPDYVAIKGSRLLIFELKSDKGKVSPEQEKWLECLRAIGACEVYLWRPSGIEAVVECLQGTEKYERNG